MTQGIPKLQQASSRKIQSKPMIPKVANYVDLGPLPFPDCVDAIQEYPIFKIKCVESSIAADTNESQQKFQCKSSVQSNPVSDGGPL
jgi:hypothetical protein